ncbi:MAG TPA: DUF1501 domain-containing protein [Planctomycetaceae bacterium]|nr:DUF1501 domain-containing protein [Planctomycetaceae bacterium]
MLRFLLEQSGVNGRIRRSEFLRLAGLGALAGRRASADQPVAADARVDGVRRARSVIVVFASGGQSQLDMWDPKPDAPREIRGEFGSISTSVPGTFVCEHMPRLAALADRYTLVRTMSHADLDHGSAVYLSLTGQYHARITSNPTPKPNDLPSWMGVFKRVRPGTGSIDQAVEINGPAIVAPQDIAPGQFGGLLGRDFDPLFIGDPNTDSVAVPGLILQPELPAVRVRRRESLLTAIDRFTLGEGTHPRMTDLKGQYQRAFDLLENPQTRRAFDLSTEPEAVRQRYGRHRAGQACLLARRLAEAGVPLITAVWNHHSRGQDLAPDDKELHGWDTHNDIFDLLRNSLLPRFDQSFSALLEDLESRGMLDETLVICMGEFGRAPLVALERNFAGASPGRKHWSSAYSILLAGAGIGRGKVIGRTDRQGAFPASESFGPWDVAATIFSALGVDPAGHYLDSFDRPFPISTGKPIRAAYSG